MVAAGCPRGAVAPQQLRRRHTDRHPGTIAAVCGRSSRIGNGWAARALFHININVSDFERSIAFYERLGFTLVRNHDGVEWPQSTGAGIGLPGRRGAPA